MLLFAGLGVLVLCILVQKEQDTRALPVQRRAVDGIEFIKGPQVKIVFERIVVRPAEQRKDPGGGLAFAACDDDDRPGHLPFAIFLAPVVDPHEKRPKRGRGIALWRALQEIERNVGADFFRVVGADAVVLPEMNGPEHEQMVVPGIGDDVAPIIGLHRHHFMFHADDRPELPAMHSVSMPRVEERIKVIVIDNVLFTRLTIDWEHGEEDVIAEQSFLEMTIKRNKSGIIVIRHR